MEGLYRARLHLHSGAVCDIVQGPQHQGKQGRFISCNVDIRHLIKTSVRRGCWRWPVRLTGVYSGFFGAVLPGRRLANVLLGDSPRQPWHGPRRPVTASRPKAYSDLPHAVRGIRIVLDIPTGALCAANGA